MKALQDKQIYVAKHPHASIIKIGMSDNPEKRLNALSATVGGKLELMYETKCVNDANLFEYHLHAHFKDYRTTGEWF